MPGCLPGEGGGMGGFGIDRYIIMIIILLGQGAFSQKREIVWIKLLSVFQAIRG